MIAHEPSDESDVARHKLPFDLTWPQFGLAAMALIGVVQLVLIFGRSPWEWHDFTQDHIAIQEALAGRNPYLAQNERIGQIFNRPPPKEGPAYSFHPPTTLVFFLPLAPLPYRVAFIVWDLVNLACLWGLVHLTARGIGRPLSAVVSGALTLGLVAVWPIRENFVEGQLNIPVAAALVAWWYSLRSGKPALAGVALATAISLKPIAGLFILYGIWRREWRMLAFSAAGLAAFGIVGVALARPDGLLLYVSTAYPEHARLWPDFPDNASIQGFLSRLFGPRVWMRPIWPEPQLTPALTYLSWAVVIGVLLQRLGPRRPDTDRFDLEFAALGATMLLVTPIIWPHYYVVLVAPLAILTARFWERRDWRWLAVLGVSVLVLWIPRNEVIPRGMGNVQLPFLLAIYAAAIAQLGPERKPAPPPRPPWSEP